MKAIRISSAEYAKLFPAPSVAYNSVAFSELNRDKCQDVHYVVIADDGGKVRFGITLGLKERQLRAPFSAPFGCIEETKPQQITYYLEAIDALRVYGRQLSSLIRLTLPPDIYSQHSHIEKQYLAAMTRGAQLLYTDSNYGRALTRDTDMSTILGRPGGTCYRAASRAGLLCVMHPASDSAKLREAYGIISSHHGAHGYPVRMSLEQLESTLVRMASRIRGEVFLVMSGTDSIAASINYVHRKEGIVQPVYWGYLTGTGHMRPMNYLAVEMARHYASEGYGWLDLGSSSELGVPDYGLCRFKESLGYDLYVKPTLLI